MMKLSTYKVAKNLPFQMYLLSDPTVKRMLREFDFYNVRFYREERTKEPTVCLDYPCGNVYWFVDFKKGVEDTILKKDNYYEAEWKFLLSSLKSKVREEFEALSQKLKLIKPKDVVETMNKYNLRDYQAFDLIQLCIKMKQTETPAGLILSEQRTGKTRVAVAAVEEIMPEGGCVVVVCPKVAINGWVEEFNNMNKFQMSDQYCTKVYKHMREIHETMPSSGRWDVRIITYDLFKRFTVAQLRKATYADYDNVMLICDEVHRLRNFKTLQSDILYRFKENCFKDKINMNILGITGTPAIKSSSDIFGIFSLINTSKISLQPYTKDFNQFKEYFYNCEDTSYGKICKTLKRTHELNYLIQSTSVQTKQRDLPMFAGYEKKMLKVALTMDEKQSKIYQSVRDTFVFEEDIDCANGLVQLVRLQQICIDPSSLVSSYDLLAPKIKWILGYAKSKKTKTIIMAKKLTALDAVAKMFDSNGIEYSYLKGSLSLTARKHQTELFRTTDRQFYLIQLDAGRESLTLPEAQCTIFLDRDFAQGFNEQAEARMTPIDGVAQTKYVVDLIMRDTVEEDIYNILVIRKENIDNVNSLKEIYKKGG
jgi:superfamily II DNA or RNA helicase